MPVETPRWIRDLSHPRQRPYRAALGLAWAAALDGGDLLDLRCGDFAVWDGWDGDPSHPPVRNFALWVRCPQWHGGRIPVVVPDEIGWWVIDAFDPRDRPDADPLFPDGPVLRSDTLRRILRRAGYYDGLEDLRRDRLQAQFAAHGGLSAALLARDGGFDFTWRNGVRCYGPGALPPNIAGLVSWLDSLPRQ